MIERKKKTDLSLLPAKRRKDASGNVLFRHNGRQKTFRSAPSFSGFRIPSGRSSPAGIVRNLRGTGSSVRHRHGGGRASGEAARMGWRRASGKRSGQSAPEGPQPAFRFPPTPSSLPGNAQKGSPGIPLEKSRGFLPLPEVGDQFPVSKRLGQVRQGMSGSGLCKASLNMRKGPLCQMSRGCSSRADPNTRRFTASGEPAGASTGRFR